MQGIEFTTSAARHGYTEQDAIHAMLNCRYGPLTAASRTLVIFHVQAAQQRNLDLFT